MKMSISKQVVGALALMCSSAGFAASVAVVPSDANPLVGTPFSVVVHGDNFPSTAGATLGLSWDPTKVSVTGVVLAAGSPFTGGVVANPPFTSPYLLSVLGPLVGTLPIGSFDAFTVTFQALAAGAAQIQLIDDQSDICWSDALTFGCVMPVSYTQANVTVQAPVVPVPAAAWLLMSALGSIAGIKRLRRS